jgi:hypothetical protein
LKEGALEFERTTGFRKKEPWNLKEAQQEEKRRGLLKQHCNFKGALDFD